MASRPMEQGQYRGMPQQQNQPEPSSVIDQYSSFDGTYTSSRDLRVEGQVKGTIVCKGAVHVAQGAVVKASVEAESISVAGALDGEITCRGRLELLQTGRVKGHISTQSLVIHEGAVYEGDMEMGGPGARRRRSSQIADRPETPIAAATPTVTETPAAAEPVVEPAAPAEAETPSVRSNSFIRRFGAQESGPTDEAGK